MFESEFSTYELCISVVTALLGLAYPVFVDHINGIADKYQNREVSIKFQTEWVYIIFNKLMVVCIIELFLFPVLIYAFNTPFANHLLVSIQYICVFVLAMTMIRFYQLIMIYYDPHLFFNRVRDFADPQERIKFVRILTELGASEGQTYAKVYNDAMQYLAEEIMNYQEQVLKAHGTK